MAAVMTGRRRNGVPSEVHAFLVVWGNYKRRDKGGPAGYPTESPFVKSALYGELGIPQQSNVRVDQADPPHVEQIDKIVEFMPIDLAEIINEHYRPALTKSGNEPSFEQKAKNLFMSVSTFRSRLESAQWYVFARMYP